MLTYTITYSRVWSKLRRRVANSPKWPEIGLRSWQMTNNTTRQRGLSTLLSNNNNFYCLKQIRCLPVQIFPIQTVVTQHHPNYADVRGLCLLS